MIGRARFVLLPALAAVGLSVMAPAQSQDAAVLAGKGTAKLVGQVVAADSREAVKYATVRLISRSAALATAASVASRGTALAGVERQSPEAAACQTDDGGYFEFSRLQPDRYALDVESPGYARATPLQGIDLEAGETGVVTLALERPGGISGRLLSDSGVALAGARVRLLRRDPTNGTGHLVIGTMGPGSLATTDAQGAFAFREIAPGNYYLVAGTLVRPGPTRNTDPHLGYVPTYYPGAALPSAALPITVRSGQETRNADFRLRRDRLGTVSGRATDSAGHPFPMGSPGQPVRASLMLRSAIDDPALVSTVVRYPDGRFAVPDVPPGDYYLTAALGSGGAAVESAYVPVTVNGNEVRADVRTNTGATLSGRVVVEAPPAGEEAATSGAQIIVSTRQPQGAAAPGMAAATAADGDGTFTLAPLRGSFVLTAQAAHGLVLKSVTVGGRDVTGTPIELKGTERITGAVIVMTANTARLQGTVTNGDGQPVAASVFLFVDDAGQFGPQSPGLHFTRAIRATSGVADGPASTMPGRQAKVPSPGGFAFGRVLPGRYLVVAVDAGNSTPILDRNCFARWRPLAATVNLLAGETSTVALRTVR